MNSFDHRTDPDALLHAVTAAEKQRGRLKIFFGSCAGVGKTYAMLEAAHSRLKEDVNVVSGVVETHGREDTLKLLANIPTIPLRELTHRSIAVTEFDLDAALIQKPAILLLDELAHTNAPGSRHPKRWQDVEELLDSGIDVYTTLNVQHLESLNDLVAGITGIAVKETVPDSVFDRADDIVLVDIPPDELLQRLREGKVYTGEDVRTRAAESFFKKSNLIALRELALRRTAERVDAQMDDYRILEGIKGGSPVTDKIMVCIGPEPLSVRLVRSTKRLAQSMKAPWVAAYVENARHYSLNQQGKRAVQTALQMAEHIGGKTVVLQGSNAVEEILNYARANGITKIVVGKPSKPHWRELFYGSLVDKIIRASGDTVDIYVITGKPYIRKDITAKIERTKLNFKQYFLAAGAVALCTLIGLAFGSILRPIDQIMIYLTGGVLVAAKFGLWPSLLYSVLSVNCFNLFFIEPRYTFNVYDQSYWLTFAVMLITNFVITGQAARLRMQAIFARKRERDTQTFYELTRALASAQDTAHMAETTAKHIQDSFNFNATILVPENTGRLIAAAEQLPDFDDPRETAAMQWCFDHAEKTGHETTTMPSAIGLYFPLVAHAGVTGVLGVTPISTGRDFLAEEIAALEVIASLLASSFERAGATKTAEAAIVEIEKEKLRNVLLSSVSHDLRTPLASIIGSSSTIMTEAEKLSKSTVAELAQGINHEASRLSRMVTNLIDVTNLESGTLKLNMQPYYVEELIGAVLTRLHPMLARHCLVTQMEKNLPMLMVDGMMIEQVFANILENAAKYTPPDSTITIRARQVRWNVLVTISDNGLGVPMGAERKIFDKFFAMDKTFAHKGTGLGLAICAGIIKAHKGEIWQENTPEGGASFNFTLPVTDTATKVTGDAPE